MVEEQEGDRIEVRLESAIPQRNLFIRDQPALLEGPAEAWALATTTIDFGCALLMAWNTLRAGHELFDAVVAALLRRMLITTEGNRVLLAVGLLEPAVALSRTLLEIELSFRLILKDTTGQMAKRLAAYHYLTYQRHGQDQLHDRSTRDRATEAGRAQELARISGSYKRFLEMPVFDDVRKDIRAKRSWHGYDSVEEAFRAANQSPDYFMLYDAQTWFVHAVNVDFDYADRTDTQLRLKALVERDPAVVQVQLGYQLLRLVTVLRLIAEHRGYPTEPPFDRMSVVRYPDGTIEEITALDALTGQLSQTFGLDVPGKA
jgi:uncharacterized protein DUF5677